MYVCDVVCPFIALPLTPTLGSGNVKAHFTIIESNLAHKLGLLSILGFTISFMCGDIKPQTLIYSARSVALPPMIGGKFMYFLLTYLWANKSYLFFKNKERKL